MTEELILLTADEIVAMYGGPIIHV
jgi:hypothetical protein